jgi:uracil-DNA glycosylase
MDALERLRRDAADCQACPLWQTGTQTVFGEGAASAQVVFVGEQPGDQEDE